MKSVDLDCDLFVDLSVFSLRLWGSILGGGFLIAILLKHPISTVRTAIYYMSKLTL